MKISGLPVIDATKSMKISISQHDCDMGSTKDPGGCAAARAIMREMHVSAARVHLGRTYVKVKSKKKGDHWVRFNTSAAMRSEIISFDRGAAFQPGDFTLHKIPPAKRITGKRHGGAYTSKSKRPKIARIKPHNIEGVRARGANR